MGEKLKEEKTKRLVFPVLPSSPVVGQLCWCGSSENRNLKVQQKHSVARCAVEPGLWSLMVNDRGLRDLRLLRKSLRD